MTDKDESKPVEKAIPDPIEDMETFGDALSTISSVSTAFMVGLSRDDAGERELLPYVHLTIQHDGEDDNFAGLIPLDNALFAAYSLLFGVKEALDDLSALSGAVSPNSSRFNYMRQWIAGSKEQLDLAEKALLLISKEG